MTLKEEIRAMLAKGRRYLASAELLSRSGDYDSAVSRLYYAMFYAAEALLLSRGRTYASHWAVIGGVRPAICQVRAVAEGNAPTAASGL